MVVDNSNVVDFILCRAAATIRWQDGWGIPEPYWSCCYYEEAEDSRDALELYWNCCYEGMIVNSRYLLEPYKSCCYHEMVVDSRGVLEP
jgi:hypothetical protein